MVQLLLHPPGGEAAHLSGRRAQQLSASIGTLLSSGVAYLYMAARGMVATAPLTPPEIKDLRAAWDAYTAACASIVEPPDALGPQLVAHALEAAHNMLGLLQFLPVSVQRWVRAGMLCWWLQAEMLSALPIHTRSFHTS